MRISCGLERYYFKCYVIYIIFIISLVNNDLQLV